MMKESFNAKPKNTHYEGVCPYTQKDGTVLYRASLTYMRKHISLGSYSTAEMAHHAYLEGKHVLSDVTCTPDNYPADFPLSFDKWIVLINFRDNNIYLGTPIYIGYKIFYYYLSPTRVLKFDMDDLFYYSSHKIMQRGNHYFVADYGLQVSIVSRYNIKPYAIIGKDYDFINGDHTDFRRENLRIHNIYHGVSRETKNGKSYYTVRIHIKGNYIVGRYEDETMAAIAYNKAADILKKKGLNKKFPLNYIEGLSARRYADLYSEISISAKISDWKKNNL